LAGPWLGRRRFLALAMKQSRWAAGERAGRGRCWPTRRDRTLSSGWNGRRRACSLGLSCRWVRC